MERLQKILASAGIASRRKCEEIISQGRVSLNGKTVTEMGTKAEPTDDIRVDGVRVKMQEKVYIAMNKPAKYLVTTPPAKRRTVFDLIDTQERLFYVGRLDYETEGLLILTNDGAFAQQLAHPKFEKEKVYLATVQGRLSVVDLEELGKGVKIGALPDEPSDGKMLSVWPMKVKILSEGKFSTYEFTIHEGRKNIIRRVVKHLGKDVERLQRIRIGSLSVGGLKSGQWRNLRPEEIESLLSQNKDNYRPSPDFTKKNFEKPKVAQNKPPRDDGLLPYRSGDKFPRHIVDRKGNIDKRSPQRSLKRPEPVSKDFADRKPESMNRFERKSFGQDEHKSFSRDNRAPRHDRELAEGRRTTFERRTDRPQRSEWKRAPHQQRRSFTPIQGGNRNQSTPSRISSPRFARRSFDDKKRSSPRFERGYQSEDRDPGRDEGRNYNKPSFGDRRPRESFERRPSFGRDQGRSFDRKPSFGDKRPSEGFGRKPFNREEGRGFDRKPSFDRRPREGFERRSGFDRRPEEQDNRGFDRKPSFDRRPQESGRGYDRKPDFKKQDYHHDRNAPTETISHRDKPSMDYSSWKEKRGVRRPKTRFSRRRKTA